MSDGRDHSPDEKMGNEHIEHHNKGSYPDHSDAMARVHTNIDVIETTTESPYKEANFIGTYVAIALGTCGAFAGFVMPVTSLALINADIGQSHA